MKARILVVDDLEEWRYIIKDALEEKYDIETAASLKEAVKLLRSTPPYQVVVTDIGLSSDQTNTDGLDLLKEIHWRSPATRTIAVSGRPALADKERFNATYHTLVYLERDVLSNDIDTFIDWVDKGVELSRQSAG